jgi:hypothetical protein
VNRINWRRLSPSTAIIMALLVAAAWKYGGWGWGIGALAAAGFSAFCIAADERR